MHQKLETYVAKDLRILQEKHDVRECEFIGVKNTRPSRLLRDVFVLIQGVWWSDLTVSWFGKLHGFFTVFFSKMLGKKSIVVSGGDDVANYPTTNGSYGLCADPVKKWFAYLTFKFCDAIICISKFNLEETIRNAKANPRKIKLIYHGFDGGAFCRLPSIEKEAMVITIGNVDRENYYRKGLKLFTETARLLPDLPLFLIGPKFGPEGDDTFDLLRKIASPNITLTEGLYGDDLVKLLSKASVYVQASEWESFGCSVAEAMLCECVPVVSRNTALPEVVGDAGFYLDELSPQELAIKIREALRHPEFGKLARKRILDNFPLAKRKDDLLQVVESVAMDKGSPYAP